MTSSSRLYPAKPKTVYLYGTCLIDLFYPEAGMDAIRLLEREGISVVYPQDQTCCGQPAYTSGYHDQARAVAQAQLGLFPEPWPVVVPSGSCGGMMHQHYPALFAGTPWEQQAKELSERTWELTDFLLNVCRLSLTDLGEPEQVAVHTSCSARREMEIGEAGPALLSQLNQVTLVEQARPAECCGFGGTFAVRHAEISAAMVSDKVGSLVDSGASSFATTDCGCLMNIDGHAAKTRQPLQGEHIANFLWRRTATASKAG